MPHDSVNYERELSFAKNLAKAASEIARRFYKSKLEFVTKADNSPVTIADETINQMVVDAVQEHFPEHGVLGEEQSWQTDRKLLWVCDPIDGTISFSMGEPTFMFALALVENGSPIVAVTADPASGDMFWAVSGSGAFMNGQPIHVSRRRLPEAWLVLPTNLASLQNPANKYAELAAAAYQYNMIHGSVFKGMMIAQGLADATYWPRPVHPWDAAAVKLIVEEAGGRFTDLHDRQHRFDGELTGGVVITNGVVHAGVLTLVQRSSVSGIAAA